MGLLDDAIREHLQLKLRHGTDPAEVTRLEEEALSPVPRERKGRAESPAPAPAMSRPKPSAPRKRPDRAEIAQQPTVEYDVAAEYAAESAAARASSNGHGADALAETPDALEETPDAPDALEETPDFLEETPEHDRLWFEQKPPSKFDF